MPAVVDISDDFLMVDGLVPVTVRPPARENANAELIVNGSFNTGLPPGWTTNNFEWLGDDGNVVISEGASTSHIGQAFSTIVGQVYIVEFDVYSPTFSVDLAVWLGTTIDDDQIVYLPTLSGHHRFTFTALNATTWIRLQSQNILARYDNISVRRSGDVAITKALRRAISVRELRASEGMYRPGDVRWHLHYSQIASPPSLGATIIDAVGTEWIVLNVDRQAFDTRWACACRNHSIVAVNETLVTIKKAGFTKGESGTEKPGWPVFAANVRAKIQRQDSITPITENDKRHLPVPVEIYCRDKFPVDHRFMVVGSDGQEYKVKGYRDSDDLSMPFTIIAEKTPWPLS